MDRVKLKLMGISEVVGIDDVSLLALVDEAEERQLIVACDKMMGKQIQLRMMGKVAFDNLYPEVMSRLMQSQGYQQLEVIISGQSDGKYDTEIMDTLSGKSFPIRCSDGIFFSLVHGCPLYASYRVMMSQAVGYTPGSSKVALPINVITDKMLKLSLNKAIEMEDYEMASNLRDELRRRHPEEKPTNNAK